MEFLARKEHGCRDGVRDDRCRPRRPETALCGVRAASSRGSAKAKLFLEDMIQIGEDVYARRNHRTTKIMQLPMQDWRKAVYACLRGIPPFVRRQGGSGS